MSMRPCHQKIRNHLRKHPHNSVELKEATGLMELSVRLHEMQEMGFEIDRSQRVELPRPGGGTRKVAVYALICEPQEASHAS